MDISTFHPVLRSGSHSPRALVQAHHITNLIWHPSDINSLPAKGLPSSSIKEYLFTISSLSQLTSQRPWIVVIALAMLHLHLPLPTSLHRVYDIAPMRPYGRLLGGSWPIAAAWSTNHGFAPSSTRELGTFARRHNFANSSYEDEELAEAGNAC